MFTMHIIETADERELVKRIFRKRVESNNNAARDLTPNGFTGDACYKEDDDVSCLFGYGAIVYDIQDGGDPELGWVAYDFRKARAKCYTIDEKDLAGLVNELPSDVFPF